MGYIHKGHEMLTKDGAELQKAEEKNKHNMNGIQTILDEWARWRWKWLAEDE